MIIVALDLSLTKLGAASIDTTGRTFTAVTLKPPPRVAKEAGHERMEWLMREVRAYAAWPTAVVAVEGPSFGSTAGQRGHHERAGLWWMVTHELWALGKPAPVVPPASVKTYATGKGNADKDAMLTAAIRAFGDGFSGDNNAADALWMAQMAAHHYGCPLVEVTAAARVKALAGVRWPELPGGGS